MRYAAHLAVALSAALFASPTVLAQERGARDWGGHRGHFEAFRGYYGGRGWGGPRYYYPGYVSPYYFAPYYATPYYPGPFYGPAPLYGPPPPTYVERYYVEEAPPREEVHREYSERSYAQVAPQQQAARPAPRFERTTLSARELFEFDKSTLRLPQPKLDEIAALMKREAAIDQVRITGYTDRIGTDAYNMKLSKRRADAVKRYLVSKGVAANRLVAVGKGEADPVVQCSEKKTADLIKCLEPNRRVEVEQIIVERRVP